MSIRTTVFDLAPVYGYRSNRELACAMGLSSGAVSRTRRGQRGISRAFIEGARRAFPDKRLDELFPDETVQSGTAVVE